MEENNHPKPFKKRWITQQMAENESRETLIRITLQEFAVYVVFLIILMIIAFQMISSSMYTFTKVLKDQFVEAKFTTRDTEMTFGEIQTAEDFWAFLENSMFGDRYWNFRYSEDNSSTDVRILYENNMLGVPRLRQLRVRNNSCEIHSTFKRYFSSCYAGYSRKTEDTLPFGLGTEPAWTYHSSGELNSASFWGQITKYDGGGYYQDLTYDRNSTAEIIRTLKSNSWITRNTRVVFLDFSVYNANLNLFCIVKLVFEYPPTGGVIPSSVFNAIKLIRYSSTGDYFILAAELVFVLFIICFTMQEIWEMMFFRWRYVLYVWNIVDVIIIILAYLCIVFNIFRTAFVSNRLSELLDRKDRYPSFDTLSEGHKLFNNAVAVIVFFAWIKVFKYVSFNRTMGQLSSTLSRCAMDILGFSIMFFIIFLAFAQWGYLLFGTQVEGFKTFGTSIFTLLRTILGDFDYDEIEKAHRILAPIFFLSYIFFVFFVLLNMFLAIINDTYADVKNELKMKSDKLEVTDYIKDRCGKFFGRFKCCRWFLERETPVPSKGKALLEKIRSTLKQCGFTDAEIEMFLSRYHIDENALISDEAVNALLANLRGKTGGPRVPPPKPKDPVYITRDEFIIQQKRLDEVDSLILNINNKLDKIVAEISNREARLATKK